VHVYAYVYVYVYVYVYAYVYVYEFVHVHVYVYINVYIYVYVYVFAYTSMCLRGYCLGLLMAPDITCFLLTAHTCSYTSGTSQVCLSIPQTERGQDIRVDGLWGGYSQ